MINNPRQLSRSLVGMYRYREIKHERSGWERGGTRRTDMACPLTYKRGTCVMGKGSRTHYPISTPPLARRRPRWSHDVRPRPLTCPSSCHPAGAAAETSRILKSGWRPFPEATREVECWLATGRSAPLVSDVQRCRGSVGQSPSCATNGDSNCALIRKLHMSIAVLSYYRPNP